MVTIHKFEPPTDGSFNMDATSYISRGKVIHCYAVLCTNQEQIDVVHKYYYRKFPEVDFRLTPEFYVGIYIVNGIRRRVTTTFSNLMDNKTFIQTGTPLVSFNRFVELSDQSPFDVFEFIEGLG